MWYQNISSMFYRFVTKHPCDGQTDGQTDGQNYDPQDRASTAASRGKITCRRKGGHSPGLGKLSKSWGSPFNIYSMAEASNFKFGTQLGFAKAHNKITPIRKKWVWPWAREVPQNFVVPQQYLHNV